MFEFTFIVVSIAAFCGGALFHFAKIIQIKKDQMEYDREPNEKEKIILYKSFSAIKKMTLGLLFMIMTYNSFYIIPAGSRGVVFRLGKVVDVADQGISFKIPFLDNVTILNTEQIQRFEYGYRTLGNEARAGSDAAYKNVPEESKMLTADNKIIEIDWVLQFQAGDPVKCLVNLPSVPYEAQKMIRDAAEATLREVIASRSLDDVLTTEKEASQTEAKQLIQSRLDSLNAGVFIVAVQFQDVSPPEAVRAAFSEINTAKAEQERLILEAEKYSKEITSRAEGEAGKIMNDAEAYKFRRVSIAEGEASRMLMLNESWKKNPKLVKTNLWIENMTEIWKNMNVVMIEDSSGVKLIPLTGIFDVEASGSSTNAER